MSDNEWTAEKVARWRVGAHTEFPAVHVRRDDFVSLLDALESALESERSKNAELQLTSEAVSRCAAELVTLRAEQGAQQEREYYLVRYLTDPRGSVACEDRAAFDPPCGGCEGCITAQVVYGATGKAVTS